MSIAYVTGAAGLWMAAVTLYLARPGSSLFSWHPSLMAVSIGLLLHEGVRIFSPRQGLIFRGRKLGRGVRIRTTFSGPQCRSHLRPVVLLQDRVFWHRVAQTVGVAAVMAGFAAIYLNKERSNKEHFATLHGKVGLLGAIMIAASALTGNLAFYSLALRRICRWPSPKVLKGAHLWGGAATLTVCCGAAFLGFSSPWFRSQLEFWPWLTVAATPLVVAASVLGHLVEARR